MTTTDGPLNTDQIDSYWNDGYVFVADAIDPARLEMLVAEVEAWTEESRTHHEPWGDTLAGRARFDLAPEHGPDQPRLRRIASPVEVSDAYLDVMRDNRALDAVAQLIGPNVEFNNSKINAKQQSVSQMEAEQEVLLRAHQAELESGLAELEQLRRALARTEKTLIPLASKRADLELAAYQAGNSQLASVITAQRELIEAQLRQIEQQRKLSQLSASLYYAYVEGLQ